MREDPVNMPQTPGKIGVWGLDEEMIVVGQKTIGGDPQMPKFTGLLHGSEEDLVIVRVPENGFPPSSPIQDMIPGIWIFDPKRPRHGLTLPDISK